MVISLSFIVVFGITFTLNQAYLKQAGATQRVVAAKRDLLPGTPLNADSLTMMEKPVFGLDRDYITDVGEFMARGPWYIGELGVGAGDVLRPRRLTSADSAGGGWRWEFDNREDMCLIAVATDLVRSGGDWLWPGVRADAVVYMPAKNGYEEVQPSQIIGPEEDPLLANLLVIDKKNAGGLTLAGGPAGEGYSRDLLPAVVTLMVNKEDEERIKALIRYNEEGKIYFSPRSGQVSGG